MDLRQVFIYIMLVLFTCMWLQISHELYLVVSYVLV